MIQCIKKKKKKPKSSYSLFHIKKELKKKSHASTVSINESHLSSNEKQLIQTIKQQTKRHNINNVTRTKAYLDFYLHHPDIHWAFLGHMVSRNGGWNMTDIRGEFLSKLLSEKEQRQFFLFLERGNWLIFQDVYPQFLLYEESLKRNTPLFYLLPFFHVSTFMETMWQHFWTKGQNDRLAIALIINEQNYLEQRVIQNEHFKKTVLQTLEFKLQELFRFNHILFPYESHEKPGHIELIGQTLHHFASLDERIKLGKRLYSLLFTHPKHLKNVIRWAKTHPHTGSRKDFWPHLFNDVKESLPGQLYTPQIQNCVLKDQGHRIFSPRLEVVWKNVKHQDAETGDWFKDDHIIDYLKHPYKNINGEIKHEYCQTLEKLEFVTFTKKALFHWKE